jgi:hypothetical protein
MKCLITFLFLVSLIKLNAQDTIKTHPPYPKRAAFLSAILPGSGQIYNSIYSTKHKYNACWKVPLIYSSLFFTVNSLLKKISLEKEIRLEYNNRIKLNLNSSKWESYDNYSLISLQKSTAKSRNTLYFISGGIYLLQILEASIDAHFSHFDISPNLSLKINPYISTFSPSGLTFAFIIK